MNERELALLCMDTSMYQCAVRTEGLICSDLIITYYMYIKLI